MDPETGCGLPSTCKKARLLIGAACWFRNSIGWVLAASVRALAWKNSPYSPRFDMDDKIKNKLPKMTSNLKEALFTEYYQRNYYTDFVDFSKIFDSSPDGLINTKLRKENILDFAMFNEGNVYNSLINKVWKQGVIE